MEYFNSTMVKDFRVFVSEEYMARDIAVYSLIRNGTLFKLTGADDINFDFRKSGIFSLQFLNRGNIYGRQPIARIEKRFAP